MGLKIFGIFQAVFIVLLLKACVCDDTVVCNRRPLGTNTEPLLPDNRFVIEVKDIRDDKYIPQRQYEVRLYSRDNVTPFIAFTISLREDSRYNKVNPRKPIMLKAGSLEPYPGTNNTKYSRGCTNTVIQSDITPKTEVKALWTAPAKDNQCVTIYAMVAVQPDVWYTFEGPLSKQVCEDRRKADDMQPIENDNCTVCEDARYQLTFEGMWSHNTHPMMFPAAKDLARFSDIVGASHSKEFPLYKYSSEASPGLKMLAEHGNTTELELEILVSLNNDIDNTLVRTLIKASAPSRPNLSTIANFRVTRVHHLVSIVTAILPSPDWFLGVSNLELCDVSTNRWAENVTFNLYPLDAGTDSGKTFDAANEATSPPQPITSAVITKDVNKENIKPFARLLFHLVRTYSTPNCSEEGAPTVTTGDDGEGNEEGSEEKSEEDQRPEYRTQPPTTSTTTEEPPSVDPETQESECPMTTWSDWDACDGECIENKVVGYQTRFRQHVGEPTADCTAKMSTEDFQSCEEECQQEEQEEYDAEEEE